MSQLEERLRQKIRKAGGWIGFDTFMQTALYEPGLGYYETATAFGVTGDFVTAVELGPWLALGLADLVTWGWKQMGSPAEWSLLEQGGGSGRLLCDVMRVLESSDIRPPARIIAVEASAAMRTRQRHAFAQAGLDVAQAADLHAVEPQACCIMFSNELPDAFPVRCFVWQNGEMHERGVSLQGEAFRWCRATAPLADQPAISPGLCAGWPDGYTSEWNPGLARWQRDISRVVRRGYVICVDYGYPEREYYRPARRAGTLMAHRGHQGYGDVLSEPGCRDITAHVDFTALVRAGRAAGLGLVQFMGQGAWLAQCPRVQRQIQALAVAQTAEADRAMAQAKRMLLPFGMGETFKLCVQAAGLACTPPPFLKQFDRRDALGA